MSLDLLLGHTESPIKSQRRLALLQAIAATGSISQAAKAVGLSYKGAWDAVESMNNLAESALVERVAGGRGGGGTRLTDRGQALLSLYERVLQAQRAMITKILDTHDGASDDMKLLGRLAMLSSARNQFSGRVIAVASGVVNDEVSLDIAGGQTIVATITRESRELLRLQAGAPVTALLKASWIVLASVAARDMACSASNRLVGEITRITPGAVNAEVVMTLSGGQTLAAIVTLESLEGLGLAVGAPATALFNASSVILARLD